jgi:hypothetical protein
MMAAGLPVVEFWRSNNFYDMPSSAVSLSDQNPESLAENMLRLLADTDGRRRMSESGVAFMSGRSLKSETEQFSFIISCILNGQRPTLEIIPPLYNQPPITSGNYVSTLPAEIRRRLVLPSNAYLNSLPLPLRRFLGWGARRARKLFLTH